MCEEKHLMVQCEEHKNPACRLELEMGTEYACIDDKTGEAYDLGRGPWYEWTDHPPASREDVRATLESYMQGWWLGPQPTWASAVEESIWTFIQNHPNIRVVHDLGEYAWFPEETEVTDLKDAGLRVYKQIGSRYDHESLIIKPVAPETR